jgi:dTDP-4-dehydrorhamnose reductase
VRRTHGGAAWGDAVKVLVTGAGGMLGGPVCAALAAGHVVVATDRRDLDVTEAGAMVRRLDRERPDAVVHLAALTDVDRCQREPALASAVNTRPLETLSAWCTRHEARLVLLSSIAVFDGRQESPYLEDDATAPANVYGESKRAAEALAAAAPRHLVVRTGWLFAGGGGDRKFVGRILELGRQRETLDVVGDRLGSPTWVRDLAVGLRRLLEDDAGGIVHLVNEGGPVSRVDLAREALGLAGLTTRVRPVTSDAFPGLAPRPAMEAAGSRRTAGWLPHWRAALAECLRGARRP